MSRKTLKINEFTTSINELLATHTENQSYAEGLISALEQALRMTDQYHGFQYLEQHEVPEGQLPGIYWEKNQEGQREAVFTNTDRTRVRYY